jgi:hypothetical protein
MTALPSQTEFADAVLAIVQASDRPASVAAVFKHRARLGTRVGKPAIEAALRGVVAAGRLHEHPPAKAGGALLVHPLSPVAYTAHRIATALEGGSAPVSTRRLRTIAGKPYASFVDEALGILAANGHIRPTRFLSARQVGQLTAIAEAVNSLRPTPLDLASVLAFFDGATPPAPHGLAHDQHLAEETMVQWYTEDLARLGGLRAVPVPWTWEHYEAWCVKRQCQPNAGLFQKHLLDMAARAVIGLTPHEHEGALASDVLRVLPRTPAGHHGYYWTILR